jgi:hypothetical protein
MILFDIKNPRMGPFLLYVGTQTQTSRQIGKIDESAMEEEYTQQNVETTTEKPLMGFERRYYL